MTVSAPQDSGAPPAVADPVVAKAAAAVDGAAFGDALAALLGVGNASAESGKSPPGAAPPPDALAAVGAKSGKVETKAGSADSKNQDPLAQHPLAPLATSGSDVLPAANACATLPSVLLAAPVASTLPTPTTLASDSTIAPLTGADAKATSLTASLRAGRGKGDQSSETSPFRTQLDAATGDAKAAEAALGPIRITGKGEGSFDQSPRDATKQDAETPPLPGSAMADRPSSVRESGKAEGPIAPLSQRERLEVVHQVTRHIESLDITSVRRPVEIRMEPAELGQVTVTLARESGGLVADFAASDPRVAQALDRHRGELAGAFAHRGFETARISVAASSATPQFNFGSGSGSGNGSQNGSAERDAARQNAAPTVPNVFVPTRESASISATSRTIQGLDLAI